MELIDRTRMSFRDARMVLSKSRDEVAIFTQLHGIFVYRKNECLLIEQTTRPEIRAEREQMFRDFIQFQDHRNRMGP